MAEVAKQRAPGRTPSGLVAFLLTDIEGSTRLWQSNPATMREVIRRHDMVVIDAIRAQGGRVLNEHGEGDSIFAVFGRASAALSAARDIQLAIHQQEWSASIPIRVRIAINAGEAIGDYRGMAANRSARIRELAGGGQIYVSQVAAALMRDEVPAGVRLVDLGLRELRGVTGSEHVFEAQIDALPARQPVVDHKAHRRRQILVATPALAILLIGLFIAEAMRQGAGTPTSHPSPSPAANTSLTNLKIVTVAGTSTAGFTTGGLATDDQLNQPAGVAVDPAGNVYIADTLNDRVRVMRSDGRLRPWVGGGTQFLAAGESGTGISLSRPTYLQVDNEGNLCVVDAGNNRVLLVDPTDHVSLVAGSGARGTPAAGDSTATTRFDRPTAADCVSHPNCQAFCQSGGPRAPFMAAIIDSGTHRIWKTLNGTVDDFVLVDPVSTGYKSIPPLSVGGNPALIQSDPNGEPGTEQEGILYVSDSGAHDVLKVNWTTGRETVIAGDGTPGYNGDGPAEKAELKFPSGLALDSKGRLYIVDQGNNLIRVLDFSTGDLTTIAGDGLEGFRGDHGRAVNASLDSPSAIAIGPNGNVYIADTKNNMIRMLSP